MGSIYPIRSQKPAPAERPEAKGSISKKTVEKVNEVAKFAPPQPPKQASVLRDLTDLARYIRQGWNEDTPEELANKIGLLAERASMLRGSSKAVEKVREAARQFEAWAVFPVGLELVESPPPGTEFQFAREVHRIAGQVLKGDLRGFHSLNDPQKREIMRYATVEVS